MLRFEDPYWLNALWLTLPLALIIWFSLTVQSRPRRLLCSAIRIIIVAAVIFALAQPAVERSHMLQDAPRVLALCDASASIGLEPSVMQNLWQSYKSELPDDADAACAEFADVASFEDAPRTINTQITDLETALDQAAERLGANPNAHILLFTDGRASRGQTLSAAARAAYAGPRVHSIPVGQKRIAPPHIAAVTPPEDARVGLAAHAYVRVRTDQPADVSIHLVDDAGVTAALKSTRIDGDEIVGLTLDPQRKGLHSWSVLLSTPAGDAPLDSAPLGFDVAGPPAVLLCDPAPLSLEPLQNVLRSLRFDQRVVTPDAFPRTAEDLQDFDAVVLSDCPSPDFDDAQIDLLEQHVRRGGGLIFIGGPSVSTQAWRGSRLESLLPVDFTRAPVREKQKLKPVHVCYVIDSSGSMQETLGRTDALAVSKFAMTKAAVVASLDALPETAVVTLIVFDFNFDKVLAAVPIAEKDDIKQKVAALRVGGGTNVVPAMVEAVRTLVSSGTAGHLIVLTDGISSEDPPPVLLEWIASANISLTAIALGAHSNTAMMQHMARETGGVYHFCDDASSIPRVFVREAEHISTMAALETDPLQPRLGPKPDFLRDISPDGWPILDASLAAKPKFAASVETSLEDGKGRPLLARWKLGLGAVTAFLSDAKTTWARRWIQWDDFERFWARIFSADVNRAEPLQALTDVRLDGDRCVVLLSLFDADGLPPEDAAPVGRLTLENQPDAPSLPLQWRRLAAGLYEGRAPVESTRRYVGVVTVKTHSTDAEISRRFLIAGPRNLETLETGPDEQALRAVAAAGDGLYNPAPAQIAALTSQTKTITKTEVQSYWPWLLTLALILWPLDAAARKFAPQK